MYMECKTKGQEIKTSERGNLGTVKARLQQAGDLGNLGYPM